jgi:hypothetical protein
MKMCHPHPEYSWYVKASDEKQAAAAKCKQPAQRCVVTAGPMQSRF